MMMTIDTKMPYSLSFSLFRLVEHFLVVSSLCVGGGTLSSFGTGLEEGAVYYWELISNFGKSQRNKLAVKATHNLQSPRKLLQNT